MIGENPFWQWSLRCWHDAVLRQSLLALQERYHADINLLLWAIYQGRLRQCVSHDTDHWPVHRWRQQILIPLRQHRRALDSRSESAQNLRRLIGRLELAAERMVQDWLWSQHHVRVLGEGDPQVNLQHVAAPDRWLQLALVPFWQGTALRWPDVGQLTHEGHRE